MMSGMSTPYLDETETTGPYGDTGSGINWGDLVSKYGSTAANLIGAGLGASGLLGGGQQKTGYQGKIPILSATRQQLPIDYNAPRRPGSGGRRYFTDMVYAPKDGIAAVAPAAPVVETPVAPTALPDPNEMFTAAAHGGMIGYAQGGLADLGYYLGGKTDGMADKIPAKIDDKQQAKLSHGEFVVPADIVSALGSGNSSAGAKVLYDMMDRIRKHAHGTTKQIKPANLKKTLPA
tara:strand:- start:542 stop:1243 length:702 start_codon:yes stop_codon:yes gene_type:complete